jgi:hypothetical protein
MRRLHAYCIGNAKSGTHSVAGLFAREYRAAHEPEPEELARAAVAAESGLLNQPDLARLLRERDARLMLEMDASIFNFFVLDGLVREFPDARFLLLIRDCYSWVDSFVNHQLARPTAPQHGWFSPWWFRPERFRHSDKAGVLSESGLYPLECYLHAWAEHVERSVATVPPERLLVIRTQDLAGSAGRIAGFLGVPPESLDLSRSHEYRADVKFRVLSKIDRDYLEAAVERRCRAIMTAYFPDGPLRHGEGRHRARSIEAT